MSLFEPKRSPNTERIAEIRSWVRDRLSLSDDTVIMVSELRCSEPGCPPLETLVAVLDGPGQRRQFKFHKPIIEITIADIESATRSA
jgi:hypothetical protein